MEATLPPGELSGLWSKARNSLARQKWPAGTIATASEGRALAGGNQAPNPNDSRPNTPSL